ncbi:hypothetical protein BTA51_20525 [Hahella sp. CCB-MM4]|uniref:hypothetical protein n=1 Tax=Hahella sp. (strain CCB-MM4) TaxID=1926491 RepID=UPI000B9BE79F|nr:hypothetical protein [Hahella sp. CCB-MM4]OZG71341.1 hypothetical protein BTA51_20525 [Hahella sp. CCB-MM4]
MREIFMPLCLGLMLLLSGCVGHYEATDFDLVELERALVSLSDTDLSISNKVGEIPKSQWPEAIVKLNAEAVRKDETGIYVRLDSNWVEESGVFFPTVPEKFSSSSDPSYKALSDRLYSYYVKG